MTSKLGVCLPGIASILDGSYWAISVVDLCAGGLAIILLMNAIHTFCSHVKVCPSKCINLAGHRLDISASKYLCRGILVAYLLRPLGQQIGGLTRLLGTSVVA
jgi:hypothetical protein